MYKYLKATMWNNESVIGEEVNREYLEICFGETLVKNLEIIADKDGIALYHNGENTAVTVALI